VDVAEYEWLQEGMSLQNQVSFPTGVAVKFNLLKLAYFRVQN
jgi:hypothetical protein